MPGTPVGAGLIDAHAGGIGTVGAEGSPTDCLAYVFGTSSCTMTTTTEPVFVPGVWGPYYSAMVPDAWLNEGGQSAAGAAIDQLLAMHPAVHSARTDADNAGIPLPVHLANLAESRAESHSDTVFLTGDLHMVPEFLGNRAPFADPHARAIIAGLGMETGIDSLIRFYIAGLCAIGYGLRQIIETQAEHGAPIERIMISGGAGQHPLVRQLLADATGKPVVATAAEEPVLLGSSILGGVAGGLFDDMPTAMQTMSRPKTTYTPAEGACKDRHTRRFEVFRQLQDMGRKIRDRH